MLLSGISVLLFNQTYSTSYILYATVNKQAYMYLTFKCQRNFSKRLPKAMK